MSDFRPQAFATRTAAENLKKLGLDPVGALSAAGRNATAAAESLAAPLRCAEASPSSRLLASDSAALATPLHTLFQQPASASRLDAQPLLDEPGDLRRGGRAVSVADPRPKPGNGKRKTENEELTGPASDRFSLPVFRFTS